jgi:hypothetical protein
LHSPQLRSLLSLAAVALAALAVSLLLAFASVTVPTAKTPIAAPAAQPPAVSTAASVDAEHGNDVGGAVDQPPLLWALLAPWAFAVDAIAVLGLAAVLIVRSNARRRRRARV